MNAYEIRSHQVVDYLNKYIAELEEADKTIQTSLDDIFDLGSDMYRELEIEDISNTGELIAARKILSVVSGILGIQTEEK
jgi:hypothetical protein